MTLFEALAAHDTLAKQGIAVRVIDVYSVKPIDAATLQKDAGETRGIVTVEDHSVWRRSGRGGGGGRGRARPHGAARGP